MVQSSPQELRDFAGMLRPSDFSQVTGDLPSISLLGTMEETARPHAYLAQWATQMAGFGTDLLRGIEAFRSVSRSAADSFESTEESAADVMAKAVGAVRGNPPTDSDQLPQPPQPPQPPAPPPQAEEEPDLPDDIDILAPRPDYRTGGISTD